VERVKGRRTTLLKRNKQNQNKGEKKKTGSGLSNKCSKEEDVFRLKATKLAGKQIGNLVSRRERMNQS
jgi:hypothetical protein